MHLSARESGTGMAFLHLLLYLQCPFPRHLPPKPVQFPSHQSVRPLSPTAPRFNRSVPLESARFISLSRYPVPSGNYYKSESQSIFNPRGMVFGPEGKGNERTSERTKGTHEQTERREREVRKGKREREREREWWPRGYRRELMQQCQ